MRVGIGVLITYGIATTNSLDLWWSQTADNLEPKEKVTQTTDGWWPSWEWLENEKGEGSPKKGKIPETRQESSKSWGWFQSATFLEMVWGLGWFYKIGIKVFLRLADSSLTYCGTLCASLGFAARWMYWLAVAVVGVFLLQLGVWTVTWVLFPVLRHFLALWRYLRGQGTWHDVVSLHGVGSFRPEWVGPNVGTPWTAQYVQQQVRARSENREPLDLLVSDGAAVARLRHGALRGRTNRHGYLAVCTEVHSSSHRYWRNQLEVASCRVHLCSASPCTAPEVADVHAPLSAVVARTVEVDLREAAGKGPMARCWTVTTFWSCITCRLLSWACCFGCRVCRRRGSVGCRRRASRPGGPGPQAQRHLHVDSETESEGGEDDYPCQADQIALAAVDNQAQSEPLCLGPCKDAARKTPIKLLQPDEAVSCRDELKEDEEGYHFYACDRHRDKYVVSRALRGCAVEGCNSAARVMHRNVKLCKLHAAKEEKRPPHVPRATLNTGKESLESEEPPPNKSTQESTVAAAEPVKDGKASQVLADYVRSRSQGGSDSEARAACAWALLSDQDLSNVLKTTAQQYLTRLPATFPATSRKALEDLARPALVDPVLQLEVDFQGDAGRHLPSLSAPNVVREEESEGRPEARFAPGPAPGGPPATPSWDHTHGTSGAAAFFRPRKPVSGAAQGALATLAAAPPTFDGASSLAISARPWRAGAFTDPEPRPVDDATKALQTIAKAVLSKDEAAGQERGKVSSIGKTEERLVFLARGCDALTVPVCASTVGKELFHALKTAGSQGRPQMRALQFPVNVNNRIAFGIASMNIGGKEVKSLPEFSLSAADFPLTTEADFDTFAPPTDFKLEKRPRGPITLTAWFRCALRMAWALSCAYGTEHYPQWEAAATKLLRLGEEVGYAWPLQWIANVWEELWSRYVEELKQLDRDLRRQMGEEAPSFERIRFFATAPDVEGNPWLRLPQTFDLDSDSEFFHTDILPRHNRMLSRTCWQQALKASSLGLTPAEGGRAGGEPDPRAGKPAKGETTALLGPPLTTKEASRSLDHRPKCRETGKYYCWDFISHRGCKQGNGCPHQHPKAGKIPKWDTFDWSIQMQLLRRGGLRSNKKLSPLEVEAAIVELRNSVTAKSAENVAEGKAQAKPSPAGKDKDRKGAKPTNTAPAAKVGQAPPQPPEELLQFAPTDAEAELAAWTKGADHTWYQDRSPPAIAEIGPDIREATMAKPEARHRAQVMAQVENVGIPAFPQLLGTYVRGCLLREKEQNPTCDLTASHVTAALEAARDQGGPELAAQAADALSTYGDYGKVGSTAPATLSPVSWDGLIGYGTLEWQYGTWQTIDFGDELSLPADFVPQLAGAEPNASDAPEPKQCLLLHSCAGVLLAETGIVPEPEAVETLATSVRQRLHGQAHEAQAALGPTPDELSRAEADLRIYAHDLLHWGHDKDYRCLAAFPDPIFAPYALAIVRVDHRGSTALEVLVGANHDSSPESTVWLLVSQGHMRLLHPPRPFVWPATARQIQAVGWEPHLEAAGCPEAWYRARDVLRCHICQPKYPPERRSGWGISVFGLSPLAPPDSFAPKIGQTLDPPSACAQLAITPPADGPWLLCIGPDVAALAARLALTGLQTISVSDHAFDQLLNSLSVLEHLVALPGCVGLWLDLGVGSASWRAALLRSVPQSVLAALLITAPLGLAVRELAPHVSPVRVPPAWLPQRGPLWLYSQHPVVLACAPDLPGDLPSFVAALFRPEARFAPGVGGGRSSLPRTTTTKSEILRPRPVDNTSIS